MSQAAGLVSEKGSLLSHTAIVGRELGIPTIVGVANAASAICTGDTVYIDGSLGVVKIVKKVLDRTIT
jgi:pyruvate,water dikinase